MVPVIVKTKEHSAAQLAGELHDKQHFAVEVQWTMNLH